MPSLLLAAFHHKHTFNRGAVTVVGGSGCGNNILLGSSSLVKAFPAQGLLGKFQLF